MTCTCWAAASWSGRRPDQPAARGSGTVAKARRSFCARPFKGLGKLRRVAEQTFAPLHHFKRLAVR